MTAFNVGPMSTTATGATIKYFVDQWQSANLGEVLSNTLIFAFGSSAIALSIGVFFAFLSERTDMPYRSVVRIVIPLTVALPGTLYAIAWSLLLNEKIGFYNTITSVFFGFTPFNSSTMASMVAVEGLRLAAIVYLMSIGVFRNMDASLEEAAAVAGVPRRTIATRITLGLLLPGVLAAGLYVFTSALETFDVPGIMGLPARIYNLSTKVYLQTTTGNYAGASVLGVVFLAAAIVVVLLYARAVRGIERFSTITGKGYRPRPMPLGRLGTVGIALVGLYLFLVAGAPILITAWASLLPYYQQPSPEALKLLTVDNYSLMFSSSRRLDSVWNSLIVTAAAPTVALLVVTPISWFVVRSKMRGKRLLDVMAFLPQTVPASVIALSVVYLFLGTPWGLVPIYGSVWIIVLALGIRHLAYGSRQMHSAMIQLHKDLEEAGYVSGVPWWQTMRRVVVPLVAPSVVATWVFMAMTSVRDTTMPLILGSVSNRVLPLVMWDAWTSGNYNGAAAAGMLLLAFVVAILVAGAIVQRSRFARPGAA
jgi:iron(III) transport system permease protein